jgi:hypothetical protein
VFKLFKSLATIEVAKMRSKPGFLATTSLRALMMMGWRALTSFRMVVPSASENFPEALVSVVVFVMADSRAVASWWMLWRVKGN